MFLARVIGDVVSTIEHESLHARKLLVIERIGLDGAGLGETLLAVDTVDAGFGDTVLVVDEGGSAGLMTGLDNPPIRTVIAGVVDAVDLEEEGS